MRTYAVGSCGKYMACEGGALAPSDLGLSSSQVMHKSFSQAVALLVLLSPIAAKAQILPNPTPAEKGTTQNLSIQNGSKSSLAFGTNTAFGASLSTQSSPGMNSVIESKFVPSTASITSSIGSGDTPGVTRATISNLKAQGTGTVPIPGGDGTLTSDQLNFASGNALLEGVGATVDISLTGEGGSKFSALATPNTVGYTPENACSLATGDCLYSGVDGKKPYEEQQFANGNATATITSNTTVDIQTNQFSSTFAQSF